MILRTVFMLFLTGLVSCSMASEAVAQQDNKHAVSVDATKSKIARLGVGAQAKAKVKLKDGAKIKGYITQAGENDFTIRDRKNDAPTTVRYTDVLKVEENRGHSTARNIGIGVAIGVGAFLALIAVAITHLD